MLRYAITDRHMFSGEEQQRQDALVAHITRLAQGQADLIQIREKDLSDPDLETLAHRTIDSIQTTLRSRFQGSLPTPPKILLNGPATIAAAVRADGVHLPSNSGPPALAHARHAFATAGLLPPLTSTSCHTLEEIRSATLAGFDFLLFGPIFEKRVHGQLVTQSLGLHQLQAAAHLLLHPQPRAHNANAPNPGAPYTKAPKLLALGGVTEDNAPLCLEAGAHGIAGIRLFLLPNSAASVSRL